MVYYVIFFILFFSAVLFDNFKIKQKYVEIIVFCILGIILICFAGIRYKTGYDFIPYQNMFFEVKNSSLDIFQLSSKMNIEIGYIFLMYIFRNFSFEMFLFVISLIAIFPKIYFIFKVDKNKFLVLFCYFSSVYLTYDMGIIRQGISLSILLFSIKYLLKHEYFKFQAIVIIAYLFHSTSIIFSFLYLLNSREMSLRTYIMISLLSLIFAFVIDTSGIINTLSFFSNIVESKSSYYANYYVESSIYMSLFKRVIIMGVFLYFCKIKGKEQYDNFYWLSLNAYVLSLIAMSLLNGVAIIATRGTVSLYMFQIICFGYITKNNINSLKHYVIVALCFLLFFYSFNGPLADQYNYYLPYKTWLFNKT